MDTQQVVGLVNVTALVAIMFARGLRVPVAAVAAAARPAGRVALELATNYVLVPAVTVGLLGAFRPPPAVAVGFLILAVCPGAPFAPTATVIARGDMPWAIGLMVVLAVPSAVLSPALLGLLVPLVAPETPLSVNFLSVVRTLLVAQLLPLAAGLAVRRCVPAWAGGVSRPVGAVANALLAGLIVLILATQFQTLAGIRARGWAGMAMLFFASLGVGRLCAIGPVVTRKATALATSARNAAVGLAIATEQFPGSPIVTAVVAYGLVSTLGTLGGAGLRWATVKRRPGGATRPGS